MGLPHVEAHEGRRTRDGGAHERALPRPQRGGEGHRLRGARRETAHRGLHQDGRRGTGLHLLQRGRHRGERARQGQGREGPRPRRQVPHHAHVPRLRRHAPGGAGALDPHRRHRLGPGLAPDPERTARVGGARARPRPRRGRAHGPRHRRRDGRTHGAPGRPGPVLPLARPRLLHTVQRRAPARAAGPRCPQPHDRRPLRPGRTHHRPAPLQRRRGPGHHPRAHRGWELRRRGRPRHPGARRSRPPHRDRPGRGRRRRTRRLPGPCPRGLRRPRLPHRPVPGREAPGGAPGGLGPGARGNGRARRPR